MCLREILILALILVWFQKLGEKVLVVELELGLELRSVQMILG